MIIFARLIFTMRSLTKRLFQLIILVSISIIFVYSCKKSEVIDEDPSLKLNFSTDTIFFDTVFTSIGSATQILKVYNPSSNTANISSIRLAGGNQSRYRINIDGDPSLSIDNYKLLGKDSLFIFIRVTINPTDISNPFVVSDSIIFETNGNYQDVNLEAWGQNANYILADTYLNSQIKYKIVAAENENIVWTAEKPYVIYGYAVVDSSATLKIESGARIYFHNKSALWVYTGGTLKVDGTFDAPVTFQGDRLEEFYRDLPGQWEKIWLFEGSIDNEINYAIIRNAFIGIHAQNLNDQPMESHLLINNTIIENMSGFGLFTNSYNVTCANSVFANCGSYSAAILGGGKHDYRQCTFANYWPYGVRPTPLFALTNYYQLNDTLVFVSDLDAYFGNNIIYGRNDEEVVLDFVEEVSWDYHFDHCFLKTELEVTDTEYFTNCVKNEDPLFTDYQVNDYTLDSLSPAIDYGSIDVLNSSLINIDKDILRNSRLPEPDLGAYEFVPGEERKIF